jgi:hypothetical protein
VSAHWEDILIAFAITAFFFILDKFVINKERAESEAFDANDRLLLYFFLSGVFIFSLVWLSDDPGKSSTLLGFGLFYFSAFIIFLIYVHSTRGQKYDKGNSSKKKSLIKKH